MKLIIKNMVCDRCKWVIKNTFAELKINPVSISLGEAGLSETMLEPEILEQIKAKIKVHGFELVNDKKSRTIEKIKAAIIELIATSDKQPTLKLSE